METCDEVELIIKKLAHSVDEIRIRALQNLLAKLEHNVISIEHLSSYPLIFKNLLEWFNHANSSHTSEALLLILKLSTNHNAALSFLRIGSFNFFVKLKSWLPNEFDNIIDEIFDNFSSVSEIYSDEDCSNCIFSTPLNKGKPAEQRLSLTTSLLNYLPNSDSIYMGQYGYYHNRSSSLLRNISIRPRHQDLKTDSFKFCFFPWLPLSHSDKHVLNSIQSNIGKNDEPSLSRACSFLIEVVFCDFPAQIFLQRPTAILSLFEWIVKCDHLSIDVTLKVLKCLKVLTRLIKQQINQFSDPHYFSAKYDLLSASSSQVTSPQTLSTSQSLSSINVPSSPAYNPIETTASSGKADNSEEANEDLLLRLHQMSVPEFCAVTFDHIIHLLKQVQSIEIISKSLQLMQSVTELMSISVLPSLWTDQSQAAVEIHQSLLSSLTSFAKLINNYFDGLSIKLENRPIFMSMTCTFCKFIFDIMPCHECGFELCCDQVLQVFSRVLFDEGLRRFMPEFHETVLSYVEKIGGKVLQLYKATEAIATYLQATAKLFQDFDNCAQNEEQFEEWINCAEQALYSINFHERYDIIQKYLQCLTTICAKPNTPKHIIQNGCHVLLMMLSCHLDNVRQTTYQQCLQIVENVLNVENVQSKQQCSKLSFLMQKNVLEEMLCFGLDDNLAEVKECAESILFHLLQSELLMSSVLWNQFMDQLVHVLPLFQAHADEDSNLGQAILMLTSNSSSLQDNLPKFTKFKANLQLLYHSDHYIRKQAIPHILSYLARHDEDGIFKLPKVGMVDAQLMENMVIIDDQFVFEKSSADISQIKQENMIKLMEIIEVDNGDLDIKECALRQIASHLKDTNLHSKFVGLNGVEKCHDILKQQLAVEAQEFNECSMELLSSTLTALQHVCAYNQHIRLQIANDCRFLTNIFRATLMLNQERHNVQDGAVLLFLILFTSYFSMSKNSLPSILLKKFKVPLKVESDELNDYKITLCSKCCDSTVLQSNLASAKLKAVWNLAFIRNIAVFDIRERSQLHWHSASLVWTDADLEMMKWTNYSSVMSKIEQLIQETSDHQTATHHLNLFTLQLFTSNQMNMLKTKTDVHLINIFGKFLSVIPSSTNDLHLLEKVFNLVITALDITANRKFADYIHNKFGEETSPLFIKNFTDDHAIFSGNKKLHGCFLDLVVKVFNISSKSEKNWIMMDELMEGTLNDFNIVDGSHFYNLAQLEAILKFLVHITARPEWRNGPVGAQQLDICFNLTSKLIQVITAFNFGHDEPTHSFMGNGITKMAAILLLHLFHVTSHTQNSKVENEKFNECFSDLSWLMPLWTCQDTEIRAAATDIAVQIAANQCATPIILNYLQKYYGCAFGAPLLFILDSTEAGVIRQQAADLLSNIIAGISTSKEVEDYAGEIGSILHQCHFFDKFSQMLHRFYPFTRVKTSYLSELSELSISAHNLENRISNIKQDNSSIFLVRNHHAQVGVSSLPIIEDSCGMPVNGLITKPLITSLCRLISNVLLLQSPHLLSTFHEQNIYLLLGRCIEACFSVNTKESMESIDMYISIIKLWNISVHLDCNHLGEMDKLSPVLVTLMTVANTRLLGAVFQLCLTILPDSKFFYQRIYNNWNRIFDSIHQCLLAQEDMSLICLKFLATLFSNQSNQSLSMACSALDSNIDTASTPISEQGSPSQSSLLGSTTSAVLYKDTASIFRRIVPKEANQANFELFSTTSTTLSYLFVISKHAKSVALQDGFLDCVLSYMKNLIADINSYEDSALNKKECVEIEYLIQCFNLLNNYMIYSTDVKKAVNGSKLPSLLAVTWNSCSSHKQLIHSIFSTAITLITNNPEAYQALANPCWNSSKKSPANSFTHLVLTTIQNQMEKAKLKGSFNAEILKQLFKVLCSLCNGTETRAMICKSQVLSTLFSFMETKWNAAKYGALIDNLCMGFLQVLSLFTEGQVLISKHTKIILIIMDKASKPDASNLQALHILRNCSFHSPNRAKILNNEALVDSIVENLTSNTNDTVALCASFISVLCANNQKAKQVLRMKNVARRINECLHMFDGDLKTKHLLSSLNLMFPCKNIF